MFRFKALYRTIPINRGFIHISFLVLLYLVILRHFSSQNHNKLYGSPNLTTALEHSPSVFMYRQLYQTPSILPRITENARRKTFTYHHRLLRINQACRRIHAHKGPRPLCNLTEEPKLLFYLPQKQLMFCTAAKVASTFWTNALNASGKLHEVWANSSAHLAGFTAFNKVVFARDPYARLLSAYIDKFITPNHQYWLLGKKITNKRENASNKSRECGHDVTFAEFVKEVINSYDLGEMDIHWRPIYRHCCPCQVKYDFIGKMETLQVDRRHLNHRFDLFKDHPMPKNPARTILQRNVKNLFSRIQKTWLKKCVTIEEGLNRLFLRQQIRGIFHPLLRAEDIIPNSANVTQEYASGAFLNALDNSDVSQNRETLARKALAEIYRTIPMEDLIRIKDIYRRDFLLFGYDSNPTDLFHRYPMNQGQFLRPPIV